MKIISYIASPNSSEIHKTSSRSYLYNTIKKISSCVFAVFIGLTTITTAITGAIAAPYVPVVTALSSTTTPPDTVRIIPIDRVAINNIPLEKASIRSELTQRKKASCHMMNNLSGLRTICLPISKKSKKSCTII